MKVDISVIIPIYKGIQYIPYWIDKIRKNIFNLAYPSSLLMVRNQNSQSQNQTKPKLFQFPSIKRELIYKFSHKLSVIQLCFIHLI